MVKTAMNYPQCQERLDERIDDLRAPLQRGESGEWARAQAALMLEEVARDCPDCAAQLRAHVEVRLALMAPAPPPPAVPAALRANVRRALERETSAPLPPARSRAFGRWAWTGGAVASAALLFLVARPFLMERAQAPIPSSVSAQQDAAPAAKVAPQPQTADGAMPQKNAAPKAAPPAPKPAAPAPKTAASASKPSAPLPKIAPAPQPFVAPIPPVMAPPPQAPLRVEAPPPRAAPAPHRMRKAAPPKLSPPAPQPHPASSFPAPLSGAMKPPAPRLQMPTEPRLAAKLEAPTGRTLGLRVALETAPVAATAGRMDAVESSPALAPPLPAPAPEAAQDVAPSASGGGAFARNGAMAGSQPDANGAAMDSAAGLPGNAPALAQPQAGAILRGAARPTSRFAAKSANALAARERTALVKSSPPAPLHITLSVEHPVTGARVTGKIAGKADAAKMLWMGNLTPKQPVSIPLAPLAPMSGDTVQVTVEQQTALGSATTLATASVAVP